MHIHRYVILKAVIQHSSNIPLYLDPHARKSLAKEMIINYTNNLSQFHDMSSMINKIDYCYF